MTPRRRIALLLLPLLLLAGGCRRTRPPAAAPALPQTLTFPVLDRVYYDNAGGIQEERREVVRDPRALERVWAQATSRQTAPPPPPEVDFAREMLVLVAAGRMSPDDEIRVDSLLLRRDPAAPGPDALTVRVRIVEGCRRVSAFAYPVEIVRVRRHDGPVDFAEERDRPAECAGGGRE